MGAVYEIGGFRVDEGRVEVQERPRPALEPTLYADKQLVVSRTSTPDGILFAGEIDASNSHSVGSSIAGAMVAGTDLHADVSNLRFCDISGIRAFVAGVMSVAPGVRLLLHGMPAQLATVIRVVGWDQLPTLVSCECGTESS